MASRRVKIHYRRLMRSDEDVPPRERIFPKLTLRESIVAAMNARLPNGSFIRERARNRAADVPGQVGFQRMLNTFHEGGEYAWGTVCLFAPGQLQALLKIAAESGDGEHKDLADELAALEIAETKAPSGHEYVHGMTYWMAVDDHFYQIQHMTLQVKAMEEYLTWLLRDQSKVIGDGQAVMLKWKFDRAQVGDDEFSSIEVGGLMPESLHRPSPAIGVLSDEPGAIETEEVATRESVGERSAKTFAKGRQVLIDLIGELETDKIIDSMPPEASLDVRVNIGFKSTKRKLKREAMTNLETGLRHIADGEVVARGKHGEIRGDDARLSMDMNVRCISDHSSLLDPAHAFQQMREVHRRFVSDGKLTA